MAAQRPARPLLLGCLLVLSMVFACSDPPARQGRVLLLGIDGANLRIAQPLLEQERLPNLARIAAEGVSGPLRSFRPLLSPRVWTTVATGKTPARHGIRGWVKRDAEGTVRLYTSDDRRAHALWNILSDAGRSVGVVNWLVTYPPEIIRGVMISDHALPGGARGQRNLGEMFAQDRFGKPLADPEGASPGAFATFPTAWAERVARIASPPERWSKELLEDDERNLRWLIDKNLARDQEVVQLALEVDAEVHPQLLMVLLQGIDRVSHNLWAAVEPEDLYPEPRRLLPEQRERWARALFGYYEQSDAMIGQLLERFGPEDLVLIVSDHGFEAVFDQLGTGGHDSPAARDGVIFGRGPGIPAGGPAGDVTVNDITPTILTWLGMPVAIDMDGRIAPFLGSEPHQVIATFDTTPIHRVTEVPSGAEQEIIEQLRSLGYVD